MKVEDALIEKLEKEKIDLDHKLSLLHAFLTRDDVFELVGDEQYNLLYMQIDAMRIYSGVLYLRIRDLRSKK